MNEIIYGDCLKELKKMKNYSVDLIFTSPPYNMNLRIRNGKYCSRQIVNEFSTKYKYFSDNLPIEDYYNFHKEVIKEMLRVSKIIFYNISIVTGSKKAFFKLIGDYSDNIKDIIVWDKINSQPSMQSGVINRQSELILVLEKDNAISRKFDKFNFNRGCLSDVWRIKRDKSIKNHGAIFPVELANKIISLFSNENDIILDPFAGTGTVGVVCKNLNRKFILIEKQQEYIDLIKNRINNA